MGECSKHPEQLCRWVYLLYHTLMAIFQVGSEMCAFHAQLCAWNAMLRDVWVTETVVMFEILRHGAAC
jgi:hypothetical protein